MALPRGIKASYLAKAQLTAAALPQAAAASLSMFDVVAAGWEAYLWGWPLVNATIRVDRAAWVSDQNGGPVAEGGMPVAFGRLALLTDYIKPDERGIACPNQDVVYGSGAFELDDGPIILQVPDFGNRSWVYAIYDARTNEVGDLGRRAGTPPGFYLLVGPNWHGPVPAGITAVVPSTTSRVFAIPRVFMANTAADRQAVQPLLSRIDFYPLAEFTGVVKVRNWGNLPHAPLPCWLPWRRDELDFVKPHRFLGDLRAVLDRVPARPGEEPLYARLRGMLAAADNDWRVKTALNETFRRAEDELIAPLMQWSRNGRPVVNTCWNTSVRSGEWGTSPEDYLHRAATARSNMFESRPAGTRYFYTDDDSRGRPLDGRNLYTVHFPAGQLPPVRGFWSLSLYDEYHFFNTDANPLGQYALGTKDDTLRYNSDGSLTLYAGGLAPPADRQSNWLPARRGDPFSLYLRAYQPEDAIDTWVPPLITQIG